MKDVDMKKEGEREDFEYRDFWEEVEDNEVERKMEGFSKGEPRRGLKGKYIKKKSN